jgi:hypothetical protein
MLHYREQHEAEKAIESVVGQCSSKIMTVSLKCSTTRTILTKHQFSFLKTGVTSFSIDVRIQLNNMCKLFYS